MTLKPLINSYEAAERARIKRELMRRWGQWCRLHHKVMDDMMLRLVAQRAAVPLYLVEAFVVRLEIFASANHPRGMLTGLNIAAIASHWSIPNADQLGRIYAHLEEIGWIDQEAIVTFDERNPDLDPGAAERKRNQRVREKAAKGYPQSRVTSRDSVTGHAISDHRFRSAGGIPSPGPSPGEARRAADQAAGQDGVHKDSGESGESGESITAIEAAEIWLATEGRKILVDQQVATALGQAETKIKRWLRDLDGDAPTLASFIRAADGSNFAGARFLNLIADQLRRHHAAVRNRDMLPLPPPPPHLMGERKSAADD